MTPRRLTIAPLAIALVAAVISGVFVSMTTWKDLRSGLLTALSVIAAATLVRLNRGLPFTNPDHFSLDEARSVTTTIVFTVKSLRALIVVTLEAMIWLAVAPALAAQFPQKVHFVLDLKIDMLFSGISASLLGYAVSRMFQVVQSDVELAVLQGKIFERAVQARSAAKFERQAAAGGERPKIAGLGGFGRPL